MAIPFDAPDEPHNRQPIEQSVDRTFLMMENLVREILTLVRWAPIWALHDADVEPMPEHLRRERRIAAHRSRLVREHHERQRLQREQEQQAQQRQQQQPMQQHPWLQQPLQQRPLQQQQPIGQFLEQHQPLSMDQVHHHNRGRERQQQMQQLPLPDLVPSGVGSNMIASGVGPDLIPSIVVPAVEVKTEEKPPANTLTLKVELCPECYQNGRILKVVGVSELVHNGNGGSPDNDEEGSTMVSNYSKVKQRIMSLLQPTNIDSSLLTAVFVIVGWKMFIKQ